MHLAENVKDELTKNRQEDHEAEEGGFIYERPGEDMCPVQSFEKYLAKLNPKCKSLFQRPKKEACEGTWYRVLV